MTEAAPTATPPITRKTISSASDPAEAVGDAAGHEGSRGGAHERRRDGEAEDPGAGVEPVADGLDRAVDDRGVVAEEKSAESRRGCAARNRAMRLAGLEAL